MRTGVRKDEITGKWYWWWQSSAFLVGESHGPLDTKEEAEAERKAFEEQHKSKRPFEHIESL
jgi:hypothetical protein